MRVHPVATVRRELSFLRVKKFVRRLTRHSERSKLRGDLVRGDLGEKHLRWQAFFGSHRD
jgi:hypothetical protein